jgi:hypothetical protein
MTAQGDIPGELYLQNTPAPISRAIIEIILKCSGEKV